MPNFNRLFEAKANKIALEWQQLQDGTHPKYLEGMRNLDALWDIRMAELDQRMVAGCQLAEKTRVSSEGSALKTFAFKKGQLRQGLIYNRKKQLWDVSDRLRQLEKIREAIHNIAYPMANHSSSTDTEPAVATMASPSSKHMLDIPDTHLAKADADADISAICGIPALLNHPDDADDDEVVVVTATVANPDTIEANSYNSSHAVVPAQQHTTTSQQQQLPPPPGYCDDSGAVAVASAVQPWNPRTADVVPATDFDTTVSNITAAANKGSRRKGSRSYYDNRTIKSRKRDMAIHGGEGYYHDYSNDNKRQRDMQSATTWPAVATTSTYNNPYYYQQPSQPVAVPNNRISSATTDYYGNNAPAGYYYPQQQPPVAYYDGGNGYYQQQPANNSYAGLEAGIALPPPSSSVYDTQQYQQQQQQQNEYYYQQRQRPGYYQQSNNNNGNGYY